MSKFRSLLTAALVLFASQAWAVNVSTIGVSSGTVTVTTATAHGATVNMGFCLSAPASACSVIAVVSSSTVFTFPMPSNVTIGACASTCGTAIAAPRVIVLDVQQPTQAQQVIHYLLWLTTTTPLPTVGASSSWKAGGLSAGATSAMNNAIAAGSFIELNLSRGYPSSMTTTQIQTDLQADYTTRQAALAANTQPGTYYGSVWDGASWTVQ